MKRKMHDVLDLVFGHMLLIGWLLMLIGVGGWILTFPRLDGVYGSIAIVGACMSALTLIYAQFRGGDESEGK